MKDPRDGESMDTPWRPLPSDLPAGVKAYITRMVKEFEASGRGWHLDVHDMATLVAVNAYNAGWRKRR